MADDVKVFISYAREDYETAKKLYDDLKDAGVTPWLDDEDLLPGQNWKMGISQAIAGSEYFLALLSENSVTKKGYVQKELLKALDELEGYPPDKIYMIPVRVDECIPKHEKLHDLNWVNLFSSYESSMKKILMVLAPEIRKAVSQKPNERTSDKAKPVKKPVAKKPIPQAPPVETKPVTESKAQEIKRDGRFIAYNDGTVLDEKTGLMWAAEDNGEDIDWYDAKNYCESYRGGGYSDWRLPTIKELEGLYDHNKKNKRPPKGCRCDYYVVTELIHISGCCLWSFEFEKTKDGSLAATFTFDGGRNFWSMTGFVHDFCALPVRLEIVNSAIELKRFNAKTF